MLRAAYLKRHRLRRSMHDRIIEPHDPSRPPGFARNATFDLAVPSLSGVEPSSAIRTSSTCGSVGRVGSCGRMRRGVIELPTSSSTPRKRWGGQPIDGDARSHAPLDAKRIEFVDLGGHPQATQIDDDEERNPPSSRSPRARPCA